MGFSAKSEHIQIRVSPVEKRKIQSAAKQAKLGMSEWILDQLFPAKKKEFLQHVTKLGYAQHKKLVYAELHDFLQKLSSFEFRQVMSEPPGMVSLSHFDQNYLAAMVEVAAHLKNVEAPLWIQTIKPLSTPYWGTPLESLRLYLLCQSPVPFRRRNIFIDATLGNRV